MKKWYFIFVLIFLQQLLLAQTDTANIYTFGGELDEQGRDIELTSDSGFIMVGATSSFGHGNSDIYLVKVDSNINYQWSRAIGDYFLDFGHAVKQTSDNGFIICGYSNSGGNGGYDGYLVKTNDTGAVEWTKYFGGFDWDKFYDLEITPDGGFMIVGETHSFGAGGADAWVIKTDSLGNTEWEKTFGGTYTDIAHALIKTSDGNYAFCGENGSETPANKGDAWLVKFDGNGDVIYSSMKGGNERDYANGLTQLNDKGFGLIGKTKSLSKNVWDTYMLSFDSLGVFSNQQWWGGVGTTNDEGFAIKQRSDDKIVFCGTRETSLNNQNDVDLGVAKFPSLLYDSGTTWGKELDDEARDLELLNDSLYLIFGSISSKTNQYTDFQVIISTAPVDYNKYIIHEDSKLDKPTTLAINNSKVKLQVFPNPMAGDDILQIRKIGVEKKMEFQLFNSLGKPIEMIVKPYDKGEYSLDIQERIPGLYFLLITVDDSITEKFKLLLAD